MQRRLLQEDKAGRTFALVLAKGEEAANELLRAAREENIRAASVQGIGGFRQVTLGYFDRASRTYRPIHVREQVEVMSLLGNVSVVRGGELKLHLHAIVGRSDGTTLGGHLLEGVVWPTLEVFVTAYAGVLERAMDEDTSLPLLDFSS